MDQDDELYALIANEPCWHNNTVPAAIDDRTCLRFWEKVLATVPALR